MKNTNLFRPILIAFFLVIFVYSAHQLTRFANLSLSLNLAVIGFVLFMFVLGLVMPLYLWAEIRLKYEPWHETFFDASHFAMAYINFLLCFLVIRDVVALVLAYSPTSFDFNSLYGSPFVGLMLALPFIMILLGTIVVRVGPRTKIVEVGFPHLPAEFDGFRILHITDLHISSSLPLQFMKNLLKATQKLRPDIVIYTGDILDSHAIRHLEEFEMLKNIRGPEGVYYVPGNHEYYWEINQALAAFKAINAEVLINETKNLRRGAAELQISGVPDPAARAFQKEAPDFEKIRSQMKKGVFHILLSHQPSLADHAADIGIDLQLSGHTHGGQFFPWNLFIVFFQKYIKGLYLIKTLRLYVNQGTGYWGPSLRLGTYCELTEIVLRKS